VQLDGLGLSLKVRRMLSPCRKATPSDCPDALGDRGIYIKHFQHIPMADMELVLVGDVASECSTKYCLEYVKYRTFRGNAVLTQPSDRCTRCQCLCMV
jgi:hypothetical protein